jgi:hypothetical protein
VVDDLSTDATIKGLKIPGILISKVVARNVNLYLLTVLLGQPWLQVLHGATGLACPHRDPQCHAGSFFNPAEEPAKCYIKPEMCDKLAIPDAPNMVWSVDFMADHLADERQLHV